MAIDWKNPDYVSIWRQRAERLGRIRSDPSVLPALFAYYRDNPADFINDWGVTVDPRVKAKDRAAIMPFVLFPKQRECINWMIDRWKAGEPGVLEKSRDVGASWLAMALSDTLCLFHDEMMIGCGSAKEEKVDLSGDPDCLFYKARMFLQYLPPEFRRGWDIKKHSAHRRIQFPATGSSLTGEAGDNIGRGGRKAIYLIDEAAHLERPLLIEASLSATTDCRIDMSSVNGMANPFAQKRHGGKIPVFSFHWRDDPRKDDEWYAKKKDELDPVILAAEVDMQYNASVEGVVIPALWVQAAIDAHVKLGIKPTGIKLGALDVADLGIDRNAMVFRHGVVLTHAEQWKGEAVQDLYGTTERAFMLADIHEAESFVYDGDGLGASIRGDARKINEARAARKEPTLFVNAFRGSAGVYKPEAIVPGTSRKAKDFFENYKAQAWWLLRFRFQATYRAVVQNLSYDPSEIISIPSDLPERARLVNELSQPVYDLSKSGKIVIDKQPEGVPSPNLADAVMEVFAPRSTPLKIHSSNLEDDPDAVGEI